MELKNALSAVLPAVAGVIALSTTAAAAPEPGNVRAQAQFECRFEYTIQDFGFGFNALLKVTNNGPDPVSGWWVEFDLSPDALIQTTYGGRFTSYTGHIQVNSPDWLPTLAPGRYANVGFNGRKPVGTSVTATNVTLNDVPCTA
ncbi:cellulose binding domain-containing protein [Saccharothrix sp. S26]|uniref:cellulose binding domain-containing protein n=1 Tax=Saccharothrix sp. S26 TaxID=2907215 RepID=UPI001F2B3AE6|nr:cellulose binding domain-containing protein [Saccharothrix sp. S26]MCE6996277.1 cellulose binding domain-containing protein [Saccharothrix sp. S26]